MKTALSLESVEPAAFFKARDLNTKGYRLFKRKKFSKAVALWREALRLNPAHLLARYNLACGLARSGDGRAALAQLKQLERSDCILCQKLLMNARQDRDLKSLRGDPAFKELTAKIKIKEPSYKKEARKTLRALAREDFTPLRESIKAGRGIQALVIMKDDAIAEKIPRRQPSLIRSNANLKTFIGRRQRQRRQVARDWRKIGEGSSKPGDYLRLVPPDLKDKSSSKGRLKLSCKGNCCSTPPDTICMCTWTVKKVCFWPTTSERAVVSYLEIDNCWDCH